ncbi:hypothetical protein LV780_09555 [Cereibacter azotoformans]|uniref:Uncharacterized protein n=1 Tax=Cereibacter azotoformans TaxID=43057 RepID=A0A2T5JLM5_9RHOB|nr:hypothetical protein [Cereibacter azotoformans]AXQ94020.1 hypothetical protein D0Z66_09580 [Cereibacter sphaeroides]PTR07786.1 hypothetical protein C8J28_13821 [Cereibacter azotoformans]UIJ29547.1 hypothetical protein LV780_09555 [Cereibacter azotoformans]
MAYTFPLTRADFFAGLTIETCTFDLPEVVEISRTAAGEVLTADLGPRLWRGRITLPFLTHAEAEAVKAKLHLVRGGGASLLVYPPQKPAPVIDPTGAVLGGASPAINALSANREMKLEGLPVGYRISEGDFLSFAYGSNPTRRALHQAVTAGTASGSGITNFFEVVPAIRPGAAIGAAVTLIKPYCKAVVIPGSVNPGIAAGLYTSGISFAWQQTLR